MQPSPKTKLIFWSFRLGGLVVTVLGLWLVVASIHGFVTQRSLQTKGVKAQATVIDSRSLMRRVNNSTRLYYEVRYAFNANGQYYETPDDKWVPISSRDIGTATGTGSVSIIYDRSDPSLNDIDDGTPPIHYMVRSFIGLLVIGVGVIILLIFTLGTRRRKLQNH